MMLMASRLQEKMNLQITGGSASVRFTGRMAMQVAGAAAREILMRLIADGNVIEPKVHYAKNPPVKTEPVTTDHEASGI